MTEEKKAHRWSFCPSCRSAMVHCGHCGNNTCNGGSGDLCPDRCASAREFEATNEPPVELKERERAERAEWKTLTPEQRDERNQKQFWGGP